MAEYQPNSHRSRELASAETEKEKKIEKVVSGTVKTKENKGRKLADIFISEDAANVKSFILMDVLVPAVKKAVSDIIVNGIDMILYGGRGGGSGTRSSSSSYSSSRVSYRNYYNDDRPARREEGGRGRFDYEDIIFESRVEVENVRRMMLETIDRYGYVTVADMYDMSGLTPPHTSNNYGWVNIRNSEPVRVRDGYVLKLPKAAPID